MNLDSISDRLGRVRHFVACNQGKPLQGHSAVHATGQEACSARGRHAGTGGRANLALGWARWRSDHVLRRRNNDTHEAFASFNVSRRAEKWPSEVVEKSVRSICEAKLGAISAQQIATLECNARVISSMISGGQALLRG